MQSTDSIIAGVDEAGRGPLAGPVAAAACILSAEVFRRRHTFPLWSPFRRKRIYDCCIADSKRLTPEQREESYTWIIGHCAYGVSMVSAQEIDRIGILAATEKAMQKAIAMLALIQKPTSLLVDGRDAFWFDSPHISIIGGDGLEPSIAAASIIAKVTRDRYMCEEAKKFPEYAFEEHKGYGTLAHREAIKRCGPCPLHRQTFLKNLREEEIEELVACRL